MVNPCLNVVATEGLMLVASTDFIDIHIRLEIALGVLLNLYRGGYTCTYLARDIW